MTRHFHPHSGRKLWATLVALVLSATIGTVTLTQQSASALPHPEQCSSYNDVFCMWEAPNYGEIGGRIYRVYIRYQPYRNGDPVCVNSANGLWMNNSASAIWLKGNTQYKATVYVYDSSNCTGTHGTFSTNPYVDIDRFDNLAHIYFPRTSTPMDNRISSYKMWWNPL